jgi:hypothetical protein
MATDQEIEQLFDSLRGRIADIKSRTGKHSARGNAGCCLMGVPILGFIGLIVIAQDVAFPSPQLFWWFVAAVLAGAVVSFIVGWKLWLPWSRSNAALRAETDDALIRPLVDALVTGGTFSRPTVTTSGVHPSLLRPHTERGHVRIADESRVEGHLADMPVVIEETQPFDSHYKTEGWIARFELPFAVAGHLRIWVSQGDWKGWGEWKDGFETLAEPTARLGDPYTVDVAPLGTGPGAVGATVSPGALPPEVVCTDALFEALRARPDISLAFVDRTLWILVPRTIRVFVSHVASPDDLAAWKKAARAARDMEFIARTILSTVAPR